MSIHQKQHLIKEPVEHGDLGGSGEPWEDPRPLHISQIEVKIALALQYVEMEDNPYHNAIKESARLLVSWGYGEAKYITQWADFTTVWKLKGETIKVCPADWSEDHDQD